MKSRTALLMAVFASAMFFSPSAHGQQASQDPQHEQHHPEATTAPAAADARTNMMNMMADMKGMDAKLDGLVKKMTAAQGQAKTDAIAELLTELVEDQRATHEQMMAHMMSMMNMMGGNMMGGRGSHGDTAPTNPQK